MSIDLIDVVPNTKLEYYSTALSAPGPHPANFRNLRGGGSGGGGDDSG